MRVREAGATPRTSPIDAQQQQFAFVHDPL